MAFEVSQTVLVTEMEHPWSFYVQLYNEEYQYFMEKLWYFLLLHFIKVFALATFFRFIGIIECALIFNDQQNTAGICCFEKKSLYEIQILVEA